MNPEPRKERDEAYQYQKELDLFAAVVRVKGWG
jgi:hypothetical protein